MIVFEDEVSSDRRMAILRGLFPCFYGGLDGLLFSLLLLIKNYQPPFICLPPKYLLFLKLLPLHMNLPGFCSYQVLLPLGKTSKPLTTLEQSHSL